MDLPVVADLIYHFLETFAFSLLVTHPVSHLGREVRSRVPPATGKVPRYQSEDYYCCCCCCFEREVTIDRAAPFETEATCTVDWYLRIRVA